MQISLKKYQIFNTSLRVVVLASAFWFFGGVLNVNAATYQWTQTLYGTGNKALVTISSTSVNMTAGGGSTRHFYKVDNGLSTNVPAGFLTGNNFPTFPILASSLSPSSAYIITSDNSSGNTTSVYQTHIGQIMGADNVSSAYPDASSGFFGFIYFQTDENSKIKCYATDLGFNSSPYYAKFQECQNFLFQSVSNNVSTTTATTTVNVDTRGLTAGFFTMLWVGVFIITIFGISKFT